MIWNNWIARWKKIKFGLFLTLYTTINSNWIRDLNVEKKKEKGKKETTLVLEESMGQFFYNMEVGISFNPCSKSQGQRKKINTFAYIRFLHIYFHSAKTHQKRQITS